MIDTAKTLLKELLNKMKDLKTTRGFIECLIVLGLLVCGLSVFTLPISYKSTLTYQNGHITYTGYLVNHRINGQGKMTYQNGDFYKGHFVNGLFDGDGTFVSHSGWTYKGKFKDGQPNGRGVLTAQNGKIYSGTFKQGIFKQ